VAQDNSQASLARPLKKEDARIDWSLAARKIYDRMRGFQPWPGAFTSFRGKQCAIWGRPAVGDVAAGASADVAAGTILSGGGEVDVVCGEGTALRVEFVQVEGRKRIAAREFANGARLAAGERFGS
jgi:methionyl-tRNA formyltransferase